MLRSPPVILILFAYLFLKLQNPVSPECFRFITETWSAEYYHPLNSLIIETDSALGYSHRQDQVPEITSSPPEKMLKLKLKLTNRFLQHIDVVCCVVVEAIISYLEGRSLRPFGGDWDVWCLHWLGWWLWWAELYGCLCQPSQLSANTPVTFPSDEASLLFLSFVG